MTSPYIGAGIAAGGAAVLRYDQARPEREAKRATAKTKQASADITLQTQKDAAPLQKSQTELQLEQTRLDLRNTQAQGLKTATYDAFRRYEADGDAKHLNNFLAEAKRSPVGQANYGDVLRLDSITRTPEIEGLLRQEGISDLESLFSDPDQVKDFVLATNADGSRELVNMTEMYAGTGYTQYMGQQELEMLSKRATLNSALRGNESAESSLINKIATEDGLSTYEATKRYFELKGSGKVLGSKVERVADDIMAENPDMSRTDAIRQATQDTEQRTAGMKDVDASDAIRTELDESGFFEADLSNPQQRRVYGPKITAIEKLADTKLTTEDKRTVRHLRSLTDLGGVAGEEITDAEAGPLDAMLRSVKQYISNDIEGIEGVAAYETFRNVFRNALYGASLTKTEVAAFTTAAGSLKQQAGPVLQKLLVQVQDVKKQLNSVYEMNDEYVATYYMGKSLEEVDQVVAALEERVEFFESLTAESTVRVPAKAEVKPTLEEIFK